MPRLPSVRRPTRWITHFAASERGNVAILFALFLIPVVAFMGAAIDYSRAARARQAMQSALDSTALMISKELSKNNLTTAEIQNQAQLYFKALYTNAEAQGVTITANFTAPTGNSPPTFTLSASGHITSDFMQLAGYPTLPFNSTTSTKWGSAKLRVALVLDNTGSMASNNKMSTLQTVAAGNKNGANTSTPLIDQLSALSKEDGDVLISIVPFVTVVNVAKVDGLDESAIVPAGRTDVPTNLAVPDSSVGPGSTCPWATNGSTVACIDDQSGNPVTSIPTSGKICPAVATTKSTTSKGVTTYTQTLVSPGSGDLTPYNGCWDSVSMNGNGNNCGNGGQGGNSNANCAGKGPWNHTWGANPLSCIADRDPWQNNLDTPASPTAGNTDTLFPALTNAASNCPPNGSASLQPVIPLTSNWTQLKQAIWNMQGNGNTDQGIGLQLGLQTLVPGGMFNAPVEDSSDGSNYQRVIILLTDGVNTQDRWTSNATTINTRQTALCKNIKNATDANGNQLYTVYTIQLDTATGNQKKDGQQQVLKDCTTANAKYYYLTDASQMVSAFTEIGNSLSKLRLSN